MDILYNPKCKTLFKRDDRFKVIIGDFTDDRFKQIGLWTITEKLDGMSVILAWDGRELSFHGRTRRTQFNAAQQEYLAAVKADLAPRMATEFGEMAVHVYAEFIGPDIQGDPHKCGMYRIFAFDVRVGGFWLDLDDAQDVCNRVGIDFVPVADIRMTTYEAIEVAQRTSSIVSPDEGYFEGIVARTDHYLYDNQGNRIMWKLKQTDFD